MNENQSPGIAESTAFMLHRATVLVDRVADRYLFAEHGIHYSGFLVLLMVGVLGAPAQHEIAERLDVSRASISKRVEALRAVGLVVVAPHPTDARSTTVALTGTGGALLDRAWRGLDTHQDAVDTGVDEAALRNNLALIIANSLAILADPPHAGDPE
jgi:DNA-binding MarR family transcriptional regulator